jgi:hypothetical protein
MGLEYDIFMYCLSVLSIGAILSILWKDNVIFRWIQYTYVAVAATNYAVLAWDQILKVTIIPISQGKFVQIIPLALGLLVFTTLSNKYSWIARYSTSFIIGISVALMMRGTVEANITAQIVAFLNFAKVGATPFITFNNIVTMVCTIFTLTYFYFHFLHRISVGRAAQKLGRYIIMLGFGTQFGTRIMYIALFIAYIVGYVVLSGPPLGYQWIQVPVLLLVAGIMLFAIRREK